MSSNEVQKRFQQLNPRCNNTPILTLSVISPALMKVAAESLNAPLSIAISNSFKHNIFPSNAKVACVKPVDKRRKMNILFQISKQSVF